MTINQIKNQEKLRLFNIKFKAEDNKIKFKKGVNGKPINNK